MAKQVDQVLSEISKDAIRAPKGTVLMRQGEIGRSAYFVIQGRLLIEREINGENLAVAEIGAKDLVGEMAILDDSPRSATVTVVEDALLVLIDKIRIKQIIRRSPTVAELILKLLCYKLRNAHQVIQNLSSFENPEFWLKINKTLQLCYHAHSNPQELHKVFCDYIEDVFGLHHERKNELLNRLNAAKIIQLDDQTILKVNIALIKLFLWLGYEDFINEEITKPSEIKIYFSIKTIQDIFKNTAEIQESATIHYEHLVQALISSNLWSNLKPSTQRQRATGVINHLIQNNLIHQLPEDSNIKIIFSDLQKISPPHDLITTYKRILDNLLQQPIN